MDEGLWTSVTIVGAALLGIVMLWVVLKNRSRSRSTDDRAEAATHNLYEQEEQRRREGSDGL